MKPRFYVERGISLNQGINASGQPCSTVFDKEWMHRVVRTFLGRVSKGTAEKFCDDLNTDPALRYEPVAETPFDHAPPGPFTAGYPAPTGEWENL